LIDRYGGVLFGTPCVLQASCIAGIAAYAAACNALGLYTV